MLKRLNRNNLQRRDDVEKEFPMHKVLMILERDNDKLGKLVAVSSDSDSLFELCAIMKEYPDDTYFYIGGMYADSMSVGLLSFAKQQ